MGRGHLCKIPFLGGVKRSSTCGMRGGRLASSGDRGDSESCGVGKERIRRGRPGAPLAGFSWNQGRAIRPPANTVMVISPIISESFQVRIGPPRFLVIVPTPTLRATAISRSSYSPENLIHLLRANDKPRHSNGVVL